MVTILAVIGVVLVLFGAAAVATREGGTLAEAPPDVADLDLPAGRLHADDLERVRFGVVIRGYRMSEVDDVLDRLGAELADRDQRLAELTGPPVVPIEPPLDGPPPPLEPVGEPAPARTD